ncbi:MAG: Rrf2 family transcriptional regulator [Deltaproteobacteria bacterium]|nr:Rrf2 family transcriptional regulator [Deltaproteobacteria bacterium]
MRLTRSGEYAVRCILYLCSQRTGEVCSRKQIAREMDIPYEFLGKIAQDLARHGLVELVQGSKGGLRLLHSPHEITLLDVVEAINGEIGLNDCVVRPDSCRRSPTCTVHRVWLEARSQVRDTLRRATFARLLDQGTCLASPEDGKP